MVKIKRDIEIKTFESVKQGGTVEKGTAKKSRLMVRERVNIGVSINTELWRRLRGLALTEGKLTGELLDEAIKNYLKNYENR